MTVRVPFAAPARESAAIREASLVAFGEILDSGRFVGGPAVSRFEDHFAEFCGTRHCVSVGSGTAALHLALLAAGIGPESRVVTAPTTFIATAEAIRYTGAQIVLVDVEPSTGLLAADHLEPLNLTASDAVIPVHLYGQPTNMSEIAQSAGPARVIEDACQAHGARYGDRRAGSLGDAGCFSFYPTKNLGAAGEGGAIVTDDESLAAECRSRRDHGQSRKYVHQLLGFNYRLDTVQAEVLDLKLVTLDKANARRQEIASCYTQAFARLPGLSTPPEVANSESVFHLYVVQHDRRDELAALLEARGIQTAIHYPVPIHLQPAFADLGLGVGDLPVAERFCDRILSLPMFPGLSDEEVQSVISAVEESVDSLA